MKNVLDVFAEHIGKNLYILPVSINEIVLIPVDSNTDCSFLQEIVKTVNHAEVLKEDFLSDNLYYYSKEKHRILYRKFSEVRGC